jgi:hypothetical protein
MLLIAWPSLAIRGWCSPTMKTINANCLIKAFYTFMKVVKEKRGERHFH